MDDFMENIGATILAGNIIIGFFYLVLMLFAKSDMNDIINPKSQRIYWEMKDIFYCVLKMIMGTILFIVWLLIMKHINTTINTKDQNLINYINVSAWALIFFGGYLTYYVYKHALKIFIGFISYFAQKRKNVSKLLLKSINENNSQEVIKNAKLTIQSNKYQDLGSQEYINLLNILIKNEEYILANEIIKLHAQFSENKNTGKAISSIR
ncbi:hypothetical protein [Staphylococcus aureus]|uniref:hypothetical protein n=1 Tax=Staphylococcus aureus TaxID=1280 RepID=UPI000A33ADFC|nr:hypothetical protein [Staphylococcus aureus]MDK4011960.1 hypothetical protein [Staphylococcus pseudintermedius]